MARGIRPVSLFDDEEKVNNINMSNVLLGGSGITLGATIPNLIMQRNQDMKLIKEYMKQNLASRGSPLLSKAQWANTYGSKLPTKLFKEASGQKGGILKWLGGRTSDAHFAPVEKGIINPAKNIARFTKGIIPTIMNMGSKVAKFPNPVMTILQGLAPTALGDATIQPGSPGYISPSLGQDMPTTSVGTSATALAQIQANIAAAKAKSTEQSTAAPVIPAYNPPQEPAGYTKPTTQSVAPAPRSRARATRGRTAPVIRQNRIGGRYGL